MKKSSSLHWLLASQWLEALSQITKANNVISVKEAFKLNDDAKVVLEGKIKSHIKSDKYEFVDKNGDTIVVEIDNKKWGNVTANEDTLLRIRGEVDKDLTKTKIDVDSVEVVK
ncbi:NirD/YgiW/YdeI family stress tolerance protein [Campylobacter concisus]|uniref:NirD/YgiW/YdeI family stress tolerance protein n=1 Tax=Campylobacter concisus TaxID=199 RepID=UPI0021560F24|nr:NirD/YgiW/YdeI family stress tolerance protein [Campylobacter concisus]